MTIRLYDNDSGRELGTIDESDLQFLIDHLEEEDVEDRDYFLNPTTLEMLEEAGASERLTRLLRQAMAGGEGFEVRWQRLEAG